MRTPWEFFLFCCQISTSTSADTDQVTAKRFNLLQDNESMGTLFTRIDETVETHKSAAADGQQNGACQGNGKSEMMDEKGTKPLHHDTPDYRRFSRKESQRIAELF